MHGFTVARKEKTNVFKYSIVDRYTRAYTHAHKHKYVFSYTLKSALTGFLYQIVHMS